MHFFFEMIMIYKVNSTVKLNNMKRDFILLQKFFSSVIKKGKKEKKGGVIHLSDIFVS